MTAPSTHKGSFLHGNLPVRTAQILVDALICCIALVLAYLLRFEGAIPEAELRQMMLMAPYLALARLAINGSYGVYRVVWRYVGVRETLLFAQAIALVSGVLLALRLFWPVRGHFLRIPISIIILEGTFTFVGMTASRFLRRILHERRKAASAPAEKPQVPTLLIGAGEAGLAIAKEALRHRDLGIVPVGFLDDDRGKAGMEIHGLRVLGSTDELAAIVEETKAAQALITTTTIPSRAILRLIEACRPLGVTVRIVPALFEILGRGLKADMLREVRIEDLLSREPVPPSLSLDDLTAVYQGRRVLVTGAGGSIGSELCRQLALMGPARLVLLEREETNLFEIERELRDRGMGDVVVPLLADTTDGKAMDRAFRELRPEVVFHAAAFKHVPMMERFPAAAVHNNVLGTRELAELARRHGVELFVMISTDKAVNPTSVMGASKRFAELVVQRIAETSSTRFSCVRFGNVLGSRGSVVGIFREQIARGGPVTVTHPEVTRYFMTIQEAVNLVLQAATLGDRGEVFLLDMGDPVRIIELARQMIRLSGATEEQVPIRLVGLRPGEKLFEELRTDAENIETTTLRKIFRCRPTPLDTARLDSLLERLEFLIRGRDHTGVRAALKELEIGFETGPVPAHVPPPRSG